MFKKQCKNNPFTMESSKYTYDNQTYLHSPKSKQYQISSKTIPVINSSFEKHTESLYDSNMSYFFNCNNNNNSSFINRNMSSVELDVKIKELLFKLKLLYPKSLYQTQILMVESVYQIKMSNIKKEFDENLKQFQNQCDIRATSNSAIYDDVKTRPKRSRSITQSFCVCTRLRRRKSTSATRNNYVRAAMSNQFLNNNLTVTMPISSVSLNNINQLIQHKNYFKLERENLEKRYETLTCSLQHEILNKINELQMNIRFEQRLLSIERKKMSETFQMYRQSDVTTVFSNETPIERKIRKRQRICSNSISNCKNNLAFNQINTSNHQLNAIKFYRNINVKETSV